MHFLMAVALIAPSVTSTAYAVETTSQQSSEAVTSTTDSSRKQEPVITQETTDIILHHIHGGDHWMGLFIH